MGINLREAKAKLKGP